MTNQQEKVNSKQVFYWAEVFLTNAELFGGRWWRRGSGVERELPKVGLCWLWDPVWRGFRCLCWGATHQSCSSVTLVLTPFCRALKNAATSSKQWPLFLCRCLPSQRSDQHFLCSLFFFQTDFLMVDAYFLQLSVKWIIWVTEVTFVLAESHVVCSYAIWPVLNWILLQLHYKVSFLRDKGRKERIAYK